jgi:hypothetical protein
MMDSAVCTLFEGHFHKGVAVLTNSLYKQGFRGNFYAGYRGSLPKWTEKAVINHDLNWLNAKTLTVGNDLKVHFLPIESSFHLSHYKPEFMLKLFEGPAKGSEYLTYFDPDIVNLCKWEFYEQWMSYGVAMVHEIVSNDMPATHPSRVQWKKIIQLLNMKQQREIHSYINAGFCGVSVKNIEFLHVWSTVVNTAIEEFKMDPSIFIAYDRTAPFYCIDQDAFNIAAMCCESPISEMGPEAMDFVGAGWTMSHATGWPKPWNQNFILSALKGYPPSRPNKHFWNQTKWPINLYSETENFLKKTEIFIAILIGRFYRRY